MKTASTLVLVTPELAKKWLESASINRSISSNTAKRYARDMQADKWEINGESIKFSSDRLGEDLVDGRHRLTACVESGHSFWTYVVTGVSNYAEIDIGRRRSLTDAIHIFGDGIKVPFASALDGAINALIVYASKSSASAGRSWRAEEIGHLSHREKLDFIMKDEVFSKILPEMAEYLVNGTPLRPSVAIAIGWLQKFSGKDLQPIHEFLRGVRDGVELSNGSPALAYRNFLMKASERRRGISAKEAFRTAIVAVKNHLAGSPMKMCKVPQYVEFPGVDPFVVATLLGLKDPLRD